MSSQQDAEDFVKEATKYIDRTTSGSVLARVFPGDVQSDEDKDEKPVPGVPTQYQLYREGYSPTNSTVQTLPSGCYEITADQSCIYVVPIPKPTGLLLNLPEMRSDEVNGH
jgi:hypothetical protein